MNRSELAASGGALRVAGIDCGTNSIRLLIADAEPVDASGAGPTAGGTASANGGHGLESFRLIDVTRQMRIVRLGQDVDRTGRLAPEALERTRAALADYAATITANGVGRVRMVATSATRDAANRDEFSAMVRAELGVAPEVISGSEEAELSFRGAVAGIAGAAGAWSGAWSGAPFLVADIGGGSTELVLGGDGTSGLRSHSMNIGCVRMTERHLHDDPPTAAQIAATVADINAAVDTASEDVPLADAKTFIGVAGTVTTVAAIALGLDRYDPELIHGAVIDAATVQDVTGKLLTMSRAERAALPVMHPGRVDVIGGGALVLRTLIERIGAADVVTSEHDILDGIALSLLA